eukprot:TRINITY_DN3097_c0_g1_i1.p1 TRINITY_DN3097_c0_g1~~TRINITY_DN3097_c0_g1_i1.p1  ORF type:complete len:382 (-),score=57.18 TRINITY_DN3097_c0_g1_i1:16-1161(-)
MERAEEEALARSSQESSGAIGAAVGTLTLLEYSFIIIPARAIHEAQCARPFVPQRSAPGAPAAAATRESIFTVKSIRESAIVMKQSLRLFNQQKGLGYLVGNLAFDIVTQTATVMVSASVMTISAMLLSLSTVQRIAEAEGGNIPRDILDRILVSNPFHVQVASGAIGYGWGGLVSLPLLIARNQLRQSAYRGWRSTIPGARSGLSHSLWALGVGNNCLSAINFYLRNQIIKALGNPYAPPAAPVIPPPAPSVDATPYLAEYGAGIGGFPVPPQTQSQSQPHPQPPQPQPQPHFEPVDQRSFTHKAAYFMLNKLVGLTATGLVGVAHLPVLVLFNRLSLNPGLSYSAAVSDILQTEGWQGFYKGIGWYLLTHSDVLFPYIA